MSRRARPAAPPPPTGISRVVVKGFKSLCDRTDLEIRPLTILGGNNSSGKSSFVQPLLLLKQTLEVGFDPGPLHLAGLNAPFTSMVELLWRGKSRADVAGAFRVGIDTENGYFEVQFGSADGRPVLHHVLYRNPEGVEATFAEDMRPEDLTAWARAAFGREWDVVLLERDRFVLRVRLKHGKDDTMTAFSLWDRDVVGYLRSLVHVPALRSSPSRAYPGLAAEAFEGRFDNYVASIIDRWKTEHDPRLAQIGEQLQQLGLTWKVDSKRINPTMVELRVGRTRKARQGGSNDLVNIADVGFGVSQVLPVLIALLAAKPGQLVYVEQPEIHLHPSAQVALARVLLDAAARGVRIIAETHSHLLILAVQTAVATDPTCRELVKLHWFKRDDDGVTTVDSADLDDAGTFGDWSEDLSEVEIDLQRRFIEASLRG